jgi:hypothetical protein
MVPVPASRRSRDVLTAARSCLLRASWPSDGRHRPIRPAGGP